MRSTFFCFISILIPLLGLGQQGKSFTATISRDTVIQGERFEMKFELKGMDYQQFEAPDFEGFQIISGPNQSTQIQYINGKMRRESSISFVLVGEASGEFVLGPAKALTGDGKMESNSITIKVLPHPDGIQHLPGNPSKKNQKKSKGKIYTI